MTYKEVYMNCPTFEELEEVVKKDTITELLLNTDRVAIIERVMNEVCEEKGWK